MARCKACGAPIIWIQMKSGKLMPCNSEPIPYKENPSGKHQFVTGQGEVVTADIYPGSDKYGYVSHYATCPEADSFRRARK